MKRNVIKKSVAGVLTVALLLSVCVGSSVFASDGATELKGKNYQERLSSGKYKVSEDITYTGGGLLIPTGAIVYIDIPAGCTLTCNGANARYNRDNYAVRGWGTSSTPGIEVQEGAELHITGEGKLIVTGGDGLAGGDGFNADQVSVQTSVDASGFALTDQWEGVYDYIHFAGGIAAPGGNGAYAPSPAIGGRGGMGAYDVYEYSLGFVVQGLSGKDTHDHSGGAVSTYGRDGYSGSNMGTVYIEGSVSVTATAGAGEYDEPGQGGVWPDSKRYAEDCYRSTHYPNVAYHNMYGFLSIGGPGGGGSAANASAVIGGGGGGGGAGGTGLSGSWFTSHPNNILYTYDKTSTNGEDGTSDKGGSGGMSYRVKLDGWEDWAPGVGGSKGGNGTGGTLYISDTATVNGKSGETLAQTDLGSETTASSGQAATVKRLTRVEVTLKLDDGAYTGREVSICADGTSFIDLSEGSLGVYFGYAPRDSQCEIYVDGVASGYTFEATGNNTIEKTLEFYTCQVDVKLDGASASGHEVRLMQNGQCSVQMTETSTGVFKAAVLINANGNDTHDIYIDGADYGKTITVKKGAQVNAPFYTMTVKVKLHDGTKTTDMTDQTVGLYDGDTYVALMAETGTAGEYSAVVTGENNSGKIDYIVRVGDDYCTAKFTAATETKTVDYYNVPVTLMDGASTWSDQTVALVGGGKVHNMTEDGSTGVYKAALFGDDATEYTITVAGVPADKTIQATDENKRAATVRFFTATINLTKDGSPWTTGAGVTLKTGGKTAYILNKDGDSFVGKGIAEGTYDIYVYGANSASYTGQSVSAGAISATIDYYTLTFNKNINGTSDGDKVKIYQSGATPTIASAPYEPGYTFLGWKVDAASDSADYVPSAITAKTEVYASWVSPKVTLGNLVRCDADGTINKDGMYLRFTNLSIEGYPTNSQVMSTMTVSLENVKLTTADPPSGWKNVGSWDSGTGNGNYIFQVDTGSKLTVAEAQNYLRGLIFQRNSTTGSCSVQMSVFGDTNK